MKGPALRVARSEGESVRRRLRNEGLLRTDLRIGSDPDHLYLPLHDAHRVPADLGSIVEHDFDSRRPSAPRDYRDHIDATRTPTVPLPRAFEVVGDIVVVRLRGERRAFQRAVGDALLRFVPGARVVALDDGVRGPDRRRLLTVIAGAGPLTTRHRENGVEIDVDLERAYFSPRLAYEHARVAAQVGPGETVYDLCCGVGPFAIQIARAQPSARLVAVDANPYAIAALERSRARYRLERRIEPRVARVEAFLPTAAPCDRAILNLPHEGIKYLSSVAGRIRRGGTLHFYEVTSRAHRAGRGDALTAALRTEGQWTLTSERTVHPYSPGSDLVSYTLRRTE